MKLLTVFLIVLAISLISHQAYSEEITGDVEVVVPMTEEEIEAEINEIVDEEIEITEINIPRNVLDRLQMAQSNISKWQKATDIISKDYQIALGNMNLTKLEMKRLWQIQDAEFQLFLMSNDKVDIGYDEVKNWIRKGNQAVKK